MESSKQGKPQELYDICDDIKKDDEASYGKLRCWLDSHVEDKKLLESAVSYKDNSNRTPLHLILKKKPPVDVVEKLIDIAPHTIHVKNSYYGMLPIHYACMGEVSEGVIQRLIRDSPETVQAKDSSGWLPLHYACRYKASLEVLNDLVNIYPESIEMETNKGETAALLLKAKAERCGENNGVLLLQKACARGCFSISLMRLLVDAYGSKSSYSSSPSSSSSYSPAINKYNRSQVTSIGASMSTSSPQSTCSSISRQLFNEVRTPLFHTTQSIESDVDISHTSNDTMAHVRQELLQLKADIVMEMTVMNSEMMKEIVKSKSEVKALKTDIKQIRDEVADIKCDVAEMKDMLQKLFFVVK
jgi:hypothetical protein